MKLVEQDSVTIWDSVWKKDEYSRPALRKIKAKRKIDILLEWLPKKADKDMVFIDAGCGGGYLAEYLAEQTGAQIEAFDQSPKAITLSEENKKTNLVHYTCCSSLNLPYHSCSADVIVCVGMIEHVKNHQRCMDELKRILKPGGYLFIVSSNKYSVMYLQWIWKNIIHKWKYGYQKNWSSNKLERWLKQQSFETVRLEVIEGIGNFDYITYIDRFFRKWNKQCGRYIVYLGKKK